MKRHSSWLVATPLSAAVTFGLFLVTSCATNDVPPPLGDASRDELRIVEEAPVAEAEPEYLPMETQEVIVTAGKSAPAQRSSGLMNQIGRPPVHVGGVPDRENYENLDPNPVKMAAAEPVSTFSIDVDTGSYANVRRFLNDGQLPPGDAVRVEEMINYFTYHYDAAADHERPFGVDWEVARTPWNEKTMLLRIGLKGFDPDADSERLPANIVFLLDVSGSMDSSDKLPLMVSAMKLLSSQLGPKDVVSIVVYAGATGVVLDSASGEDQGTIRAALSQLHAGGSTAGGAGIQLAYALAEKNFVKKGINRVFLATDGDFNVGVTDIDALKDLVSRMRETGISLTTLGFGTGNYNDHLLEQIADVGNGNYAYIDSLSEGRKVLVEELSRSLVTIAKDVKIQIEFNPAIVAEYRLIGYENRMLKREDFNNDKVDAGEIGAGHTVTALYEIALVGSGGERVDPLRYGDVKPAEADHNSDEFAFLKLRYKLPNETKSKLHTVPLATSALSAESAMSADLRFAGAVAAFGQHLKGGTYLGGFGYNEILALAEDSANGSNGQYRSEFLELVRLAKALEEPARTGER